MRSRRRRRSKGKLIRILRLASPRKMLKSRQISNSPWIKTIFFNAKLPNLGDLKI
jgi:hypothetical protein